MDEDVMWALLAMVIWGPPVFALSIRFAIKPVVEAIRTLRESQNPPPDQRRLNQLEAEIARLSARLESVEQAEAFHRELGSGPGAGSGL
jgi:hypothetical protein